MDRSNGGGRRLSTVWACASLLGFLSLALFPVGINVAAALICSAFPPCGANSDRLELSIFYFSIFVAPLGPFYWFFWGGVVTIARLRARFEIALLSGGAGFLVLILVTAYVGVFLNA
jgi:hypothetical protein